MEGKKDMVLTIELDYSKTWDRSTAEIIRRVRSWDYKTIRKVEEKINALNQKYWDAKNANKPKADEEDFMF